MSHLVQCNPHSIGKVINCTQFSFLCRLLRVTAYVMRFCRLLKAKARGLNSEISAELSASKIEAVETLWVTEACKGRLGNADISYSTRYPALLMKDHHFTVLIVKDAHRRVMHSGVKETLTEVRSKYWIIKGRQFVRQIIYKCVVCRKSLHLATAAPSS